MCLACRARYFGIHLSTDGFLSLFPLTHYHSTSFFSSIWVQRRTLATPLRHQHSHLFSSQAPGFDVHTHHNRQWVLVFSFNSGIQHHRAYLITLLRPGPPPRCFTHHHSGSWSFLWVLASNITEHTSPHFHVQAPLLGVHTHHNSGPLDLSACINLLWPLGQDMSWWISGIHPYSQLVGEPL